ncbi:hypothetical protein KS4_07690 [Poriferisphaera corsica]|uniref:Uncharacterized protein n=1 Tax=Poriferisphaera corsica TaxID=2528020 RepID=A0A517YR76_9BACT|nr:hypothetical protein KS4_07690 [Poriferisphaera corsica]
MNRNAVVHEARRRGRALLYKDVIVALHYYLTVA